MRGDANMKKAAIDVVFGFLTVIAVMICEFIVTLPFGQPENRNADQYFWLVNSEFLLTSLPALLTTFLFARLLKSKDIPSVLRRSTIWTAILALNYFVIGIGNANLKTIFGGIGIYCLLGCAFMGPVLYGKTKRF